MRIRVIKSRNSDPKIVEGMINSMGGVDLSRYHRSESHLSEELKRLSNDILECDGVFYYK